MRRVNAWTRFLLFVIGFGGLFLAPLDRVFAANGTSFSQAILPVKLVYFDARGNVGGIWSNVEQGHSAYVLKAFDAKGQELPLTERRLEAAKQSLLIKEYSCSDRCLHLKFVDIAPGNMGEILTVV